VQAAGETREKAVRSALEAALQIPNARTRAWALVMHAERFTGAELQAVAEQASSRASGSKSPRIARMC
jgi:hypothetical protein